MAVCERKYALSKVATGDYILPSNDGLTIWRIARYTDGPSQGLDLPRDRDFWGLWRWKEPGSPYIDVADWTRWKFTEGFLETRTEAIDVALRISV